MKFRRAIRDWLDLRDIEAGLYQLNGRIHKAFEESERQGAFLKKYGKAISDKRLELVKTAAPQEHFFFEIPLEDLKHFKMEGAKVFGLSLRPI